MNFSVNQRKRPALEHIAVWESINWHISLNRITVSRSSARHFESPLKLFRLPQRRALFTYTFSQNNRNENSCNNGASAQAAPITVKASNLHKALRRRPLSHPLASDFASSRNSETRRKSAKVTPIKHVDRGLVSCERANKTRYCTRVYARKRRQREREH